MQANRLIIVLAKGQVRYTPCAAAAGGGLCCCERGLCEGAVVAGGLCGAVLGGFLSVLRMVFVVVTRWPGGTATLLSFEMVLVGDLVLGFMIRDRAGWAGPSLAEMPHLVNAE